MSILYLNMKYPLSSGVVGVVKGNQVLTRKCYKDRRKFKNKTLGHSEDVNIMNLDFIDLDPREDSEPDSLLPIGELKTI